MYDFFQQFTWQERQIRLDGPLSSLSLAPDFSEAPGRAVTGPLPETNIQLMVQKSGEPIDMEKKNIYIYIWYPPPKKSTFFMGKGGIYIYIYMVPPPKTHTFSEFTGICAILLLLTMFKCLFFFWRLFYIFKKLCRVVKTLPPLIKLFSFNRKGFLLNLEKTKKPKNQNFLEKFWFQVKRCFFLVFLEFFCFFLV